MRTMQSGTMISLMALRPRTTTRYCSPPMIGMPSRARRIMTTLSRCSRRSCRRRRKWRKRNGWPRKRSTLRTRRSGPSCSATCPARRAICRRGCGSFASTFYLGPSLFVRACAASRRRRRRRLPGRSTKCCEQRSLRLAILLLRAGSFWRGRRTEPFALQLICVS